MSLTNLSSVVVQYEPGYYTNHRYLVLILSTLISPWGMRTMRRVEHLRAQLPNILLQAMHRAGYLRAQIKEELQGLTSRYRSSGRRPRIQNNWFWICSYLESTENNLAFTVTTVHHSGYEETAVVHEETAVVFQASPLQKRSCSSPLRGHAVRHAAAGCDAVAAKAGGSEHGYAAAQPRHAATGQRCQH